MREERRGRTEVQWAGLTVGHGLRHQELGGGLGREGLGEGAIGERRSSRLPQSVQSTVLIS